MNRHASLLCLALGLAHTSLHSADSSGGRLSFHSLPTARFEFRGPVGDRLQANIDHWLLRAPQSNPGMIEMFRLRDREPAPQLVPWAGEFVGKYLLSAVTVLQMSDDPRLRPQIQGIVSAFLATQAEDGYLGPFPKDVRLLKHWDLWGHYHAIAALLRWEEQTGDAAALAAARRAADLVCRTYLDPPRRVLQAGDPEMNMTILTGLAALYRRTGEPRYLRMVRAVEREWEEAGDYLRAGLDGREFHQSPRPRWESLHDLQGLLELWQITGEAKYREAFAHHWRSLRRCDRRNTGGFSSGEQATGNPYANTAIETCCTVAWMALTVDYLRLTGDARAADDLELATLNGGLGAQHPSGRWWTYNTPMNGAREASAHTIVFQARAGTPELNCCSVNGPRVLAMLADWTLMSAPDGLIVNWLGAGRFTVKLPDGTPVTLTSSQDAWREGQTELRVITEAKEPFVLRVRLPAWAVTPTARLNGVALSTLPGGQYLTLKRRWKSGDRLALSFDLPVRFVPGANETAGQVSLYRGPLLLAYDQAYSPCDEAAVPPVDLTRLAQARVVPGPLPQTEPGLPPWLVVDLPASDGRTVRLVDFASAGSRGTRYRSWLAAQPAPPPPALTRLPPDGARLPPAVTQFRWRGPREVPGLRYRLEFATNREFIPILSATNSLERHLAVDLTRLGSTTRSAEAGDASARRAAVYWRVVAIGDTGETLADVPPAWFSIDPAAPPQTLPPEPRLGPDGELVQHSLRGDAPPRFGELASAHYTARNAEGTEVNGRDQLLRYALGAWPEEDFSVTVRVRVCELPTGRLGQVFSAWCAVMDDPLRLVIDGGRLHARVEAGGACSTPGVVVRPGQWYAVAAVKRGGQLTLYVDGKPAGSAAVPELISSRAQDCALGGNPHYAGNEFLAAGFADFRLYGRALRDDEVQRLANLD